MIKPMEDRFDKHMALALIFLIGFGVIQVYSSSYIYASEQFQEGTHFLFKQGLFAVLGGFTLAFVSQLKWKFCFRLGLLVYALSAAGIILTLVPGFGVQVGGATRWLQLPFGFRFEPSEFLKVSLPLVLAGLFIEDSRKKLNEKKLSQNLWLRSTIILVPTLLLLKQPDFGSLVLSGLIMISILFVFGLSWKYLASLALGAIPTFYFLVWSVPYRKLRVVSFLDPWSAPDAGGFQVIQSLLSFHSGGLFGVGLGEGQGKLFFLPEAHTDFTLAVLGEELGFLGFLLLMSIYAFLVFRGLQIASRSQSNRPKAVALGLTVLFASTVLINVGVVLGLLPPKGLTLPFLSYGGSSLLATCLLFGFLLNIQRNFESHGAQR